MDGLLDEPRAAIDHDQQAGEVEPVASRQQHGLAADLAGQLAERNDRTGERHGADQHANVDLQLVDRFLGTLEMTGRGRVDVIGEAHQHGRETDEAVHEGDQLRHLGHLHDPRRVDADRCSNRERADDPGIPAGRDLRSEQGRENGDRHADHAVEIATAGRLGIGEPAEAQNEQDGRSEIRDRC